ncbi:inositol-pentakisphosphate 2-kinase [Lipomyces orientalis]|uniref:Inositol-pentakisphosphate 2-kinase n=1 Tax=Lipomyces orientalis TaxID=1233043 RepID=A0ACC3TY49_9ASCO
MSSSSEPSADKITDASALTFIAEGAANLLYRINDDKHSFYLLRLRKKQPSQPSTLDVYSFNSKHILPLFGSDMVASMRLVKLEPAVLQQLNKNLAGLESAGVRNPNRHGTVLDTDELYGILVENMTAESVHSDLPIVSSGRKKIKGSSGVLSYVIRENRGTKLEVAVLEFKPKWLTQSKDAPSDWKYCRTCALRRYRAKDASVYAFCPLDLVSGNRQRVEKSVRALLPDQLVIKDGSILTVERLRRVVTEFILNSEMFKTLARIQEKMDADGVLNTSGSEDAMNFLIAMTVRDCTAFLRIVYAELDQDKIRDSEINHAGTHYFTDQDSTYITDDGYYFAVSCRLADLDIKDGSGTKRAYWQSIEKNLNEGGWYTSDDALTEPCRK